GVVAAQGGQVVAHRVAGDPVVVTAVEGRCQAQMRGAGLLPETRLAGPVGLRPRTHRDPYLDPDLGRVAAGGFGHGAHPGDDVERLLAGRIGVGHPAVAIFGDALQGALVVAA